MKNTSPEVIRTSPVKSNYQSDTNTLQQVSTPPVETTEQKHKRWKEEVEKRYKELTGWF